MKQTHIGGQAVIEGVMMRGKKSYTVAVRKPDQDIAIDKKPIRTIADRWKIFKLPIFRGMLAFVESMVVGIRTLTYSAEFFEVEEDEKEPSKLEKMITDKVGDKLDDYVVGFSIFIAILFAVGFFMVLPLFITRLFDHYITQGFLRNLVEGVIRMVLFLGYILLISRMKDIQRVFQYHGAEHKTINCFEHEEELTVENVKKHTRYHKRCGTSFLLIVMIVSVLVFMLVEVDTIWLRFASRIILVPFIAGISYEIIKWAGSSESSLVQFISLPGMYLQRVTTSEPDDHQIEVAIHAMKGVLEDEQEQQVP